MFMRTSSVRSFVFDVRLVGGVRRELFERERRQMQDCCVVKVSAGQDIDGCESVVADIGNQALGKEGTWNKSGEPKGLQQTIKDLNRGFLRRRNEEKERKCQRIALKKNFENHLKEILVRRHENADTHGTSPARV